MAIKTIIVDDEYLGIQVLENFVSKIPTLNLCGTFENPLEAIDYIQRNPVDLIFLDIQMPQISGTSFLKSLSKPPLVVFTTAYSEYAVEAFDLNVVDYLLKPIPFERFLKTINKINDIFQRGNNSPDLKKTETGTLTVKSDGALYKIPFAEIRYIESDREYVKLFTQNKRYYYLETMKNLEESLPPDQFIRVHKSYIVSKACVRSIDGNQLDLGGVQIPVSREKRTDIITALFGKPTGKKPQN
ncbi:MAG: response regulator transcription factor [Bacteroidetes bacterium]|nr:response regulator transcription factor [Bacteroidota bacterium]